MRLISAFSIIALMATAGCSEATEVSAASPYVVNDIEVTARLYVGEGVSYTRHHALGKNIDGSVTQLNKELEPYGVKIRRTSDITVTDEKHSNLLPSVLINGQPIDYIVAGLCLKADCVEYNGERCESVPPEAIREGILVVARALPRPPPPEPVSEAGEPG